MDTVAIDVQRVSRVYIATTGMWRRVRREVTALSEVTFSIAPGELFGMVGPNGAGKTTLIKILTTLLLQTTGQARVLGYDVVNQTNQIRKRINVVFGGDRGLYGRLSAYNNLAYFAELYRVSPTTARQRLPQLLDLVGLRDRADDRVEIFSRGMRQRLHIAKSLINDPEVLFLDEPTIGLDPGAAYKLRAIVRDVQAMGKTVVITSHNMYEIDALCARIAVINKGRLLTIDTPQHLKHHVADLRIVEAQIYHGFLEESVLLLLRQLNGVLHVNLSMTGRVQMVSIQTCAAEATSVALRAYLPSEDIDSVVIRQPTLEDAYLRIVGTGS